MSEDWIWHQYDYTGVAKFINPDVKNELYIEENVFDLINKNYNPNHQDLTPLIKLLYDKLKEQRIRYNNEKGMTDDNQAQFIRKPNEILNGNKEGTCLDLTLLFCGLCCGHGLLPIFVLLEKHALVAVSKKIKESEKKSIKRPLKQLLEKGAVINDNNNALNKLRTLVEQQDYILIECTGFAHTETISNNFPEGEGRVDGFLDFESAVEAGHKQLNRRKLKMFIDVEIAHRLLRIKPLPLQPNLVDNTNHLSSERVGNAVSRYVRLGDFPKGRWINCAPQTEVIRSLVIDPRNSRILYAGSYRNRNNQSARVYKSVNNGRFWKLANHGLPNLEKIFVLAIHYFTQKIYAGTNEGLFISTNGGNSWVKDERFLDLQVICIALSQQDEKLVICGTVKPGGTSVGSSTVVSAASQNSNDLHSGGLHISFGSGESLRTISIQNVNAVVISPKDRSIIYVGTSDDGGVYRSLNGGVKWEEIPKPKARHIFSLAVSPTNSYKIFAGTENGLYLSLDGGESWQIIPEISKSQVSSIQFSPSNDNQILVATAVGIFESQDGGASWQVPSHELTQHFNCVVISSPEGTIYAGTGGGGVYKKEQNQLFWQSCNDGFFNESLSGESLLVDNNNLIFLGTSYGLFKSLNGGSSWEKILKNYPASSILSLATAPKRSVNSSCANSSGGLFISTDSGHSWQSPSEVFSDLIYAGSTQGRIYRSTDGGSSWQLVGNLKGNEVYSLAVSAENINIVYAGVIGGGVYKSIDGGDSWNPINTGLDNLEVTSLMLSKDSSLLYAASRHQVYRSRDQGKSWQNCTDGLPNEPIYSMIQSHQVSNLIYVATNGGGVYKSVNGGDSWIPKNNGLLNLAVIALELSPENSSILYAGTRNGVFKSIDGGECWQTFSDGLGQNQTINQLAFSPENKNLLYAATMKGSVYKVLDLPHE